MSAACSAHSVQATAGDDVHGDKENRRMRWSIWKGALIVALACSSASWGQHPAPAPQGEVIGARYLMVGDPPQKCRVVAVWQTEDGSEASDVQSVDTGEMMTIVEVRDNSR